MAGNSVAQAEVTQPEKVKKAVETLREFVYQVGATSELIGKVGSEEVAGLGYDPEHYCRHLADSLFWTIERDGGPLDALAALERMAPANPAGGRTQDPCSE